MVFYVGINLHNNHWNQQDLAYILSFTLYAVYIIVSIKHLVLNFWQGCKATVMLDISIFPSVVVVYQSLAFCQIFAYPFLNVSPLFFCLLIFLLPSMVPLRMVFAKPLDFLMWSCHHTFSFASLLWHLHWYWVVSQTHLLTI